MGHQPDRVTIVKQAGFAERAWWSLVLGITIGLIVFGVLGCLACNLALMLAQ